MFLYRPAALLAAAAFIGTSFAQNCACPAPDGYDDQGNPICTWEQNPTPYVCVSPNCGPAEACHYDSYNCALKAGWNVDSHCCTAPAQASCANNPFQPMKCGNKNCAYDNMCLAAAAGFSAGQCSANTGAECPFNDWGETTGYCANEPLNPITCGNPVSGMVRPCYFDNPCLASAAGFNTNQGSTDCCQSGFQGVSCQSWEMAVVCGTGNCPYSCQAQANSAGYNPNQCQTVSVPQSMSDEEPEGKSETSAASGKVAMSGLLGALAAWMAII